MQFKIVCPNCKQEFTIEAEPDTLVECRCPNCDKEFEHKTPTALHAVSQKKIEVAKGESKLSIITKRILKIVFFMAFLGAVFAGGWFYHSYSVQMRNAVVVDSDSIRDAMHKQALELEKRKPLLQTPDLTLFDLQGNVESVTITGQNTSHYVWIPYTCVDKAHFDEEGNLKDMSHNNGDIMLGGEGNRHFIARRDKQGRITSLYPSRGWDTNSYGGKMSISYNSDGKPVYVRMQIEGGEPIMTAKYDAMHLPYYISMRGYAVHYFYYKYLEFDDQRNWTKRECKYHYPAPNANEEEITETWIEERTINYYPSKLEEEGESGILDGLDF